MWDLLAKTIGSVFVIQNIGAFPIGYHQIGCLNYVIVSGNLVDGLLRQFHIGTFAFYNHKRP